MREEAVVVLRLDSSGMPAGAQQAEQAFQRVASAGQISARQTAAAMRTLPAQFTDIATQLAGGQSPLLILLQQGGQIKDSFGGVGNAIRGISDAITPARMAMGSAAAVVGALGFAAYEGAKQQKELRDTIALTGNAAGLTADRLRIVADATSAASAQTVGGAREIAMALASSGMVSSSTLQVLATAVARVADVSGKSATEIAADFAKMGNGVADWAAEHNKAWNFLTAEQWKYIKRLEEQGKAEDAARIVGQKVIEHLEGQRKELGYVESAWDKVGKAASAAWRAMSDWGKEDPLSKQIESARSLAAGLRDRLERNLLSGGGEAAGAPGKSQNDVLREQLAQAEAQLESLTLKRRAGEAIADAASARSAAERAKIKALQDAAKQHGSASGGRPYIPSDDSNWDARDWRMELARRDAEENRILAILEHEDPAAKKRAAAEARRMDEEYNRALARQQEFLEDLATGARRAAAEQIQDEHERWAALAAIDREGMLKRLREIGASDSVRQQAQALFNDQANAGARTVSKQAGEAIYDDTRSALVAAFRDSAHPARAFAEALASSLYNRVAAALADAIAVSLVGRNGHGGSMGGWLSSLISGVVGGGLSIDASANAPAVDKIGNAGGGMATGTNYVPRDMFALLHRGEAVVPARYNPAAGGAGGRAMVVQQITYQVPPGMSPAAYAAALAENNRALKAEIASDLARPGRMMNSAMRSGS